MDSPQFTVLIGRCVMQINPEPFFKNSDPKNIRKLLRFVFKEPDRNTETIACLGEYLTVKVAEAKTALDANPRNRLSKHKYNNYSKILTYFETLKTRHHF